MITIVKSEFGFANTRSSRTCFREVALAARDIRGIKQRSDETVRKYIPIHSEYSKLVSVFERTLSGSRRQSPTPN
jgi:hypothetical protein